MCVSPIFNADELLKVWNLIDASLAVASAVGDQSVVLARDFSSLSISDDASFGVLLPVDVGNEGLPWEAGGGEEFHSDGSSELVLFFDLDSKRLLGSILDVRAFDAVSILNLLNFAGIIGEWLGKEIDWVFDLDLVLTVGGEGVIAYASCLSDIEYLDGVVSWSHCGEVETSVSNVVVHNSLLYNFELFISDLYIVAIVCLRACSELHSLAEVIKSKSDWLFLRVVEIEFGLMCGIDDWVDVLYCFCSVGLNDCILLEGRLEISSSHVEELFIQIILGGSWSGEVQLLFECLGPFGIFLTPCTGVGVSLLISTSEHNKLDGSFWLGLDRSNIHSLVNMVKGAILETVNILGGNGHDKVGVVGVLGDVGEQLCFSLISGIILNNWSTSKSSQSFNIVATIKLDVVSVEFGECLLEDSRPPSTVLSLIQTKGGVFGLVDWELVVEQNLGGLSLIVELNLEDSFGWIVLVSEDSLELLRSVGNGGYGGLDPLVSENANVWSDWPNALLTPKLWLSSSGLIQISWGRPAGDILLIHSDECGVVTLWHSELKIPIKRRSIGREVFIIILSSGAKEILVDAVTFLVVEQDSVSGQGALIWELGEFFFQSYSSFVMNWALLVSSRSGIKCGVNSFRDIDGGIKLVESFGKIYRVISEKAHWDVLNLGERLFWDVIVLGNFLRIISGCRDVFESPCCLFAGDLLSGQLI